MERKGEELGVLLGVVEEKVNYRILGVSPEAGWGAISTLYTCTHSGLLQLECDLGRKQREEWSGRHTARVLLLYSMIGEAIRV